MLSDAHRRDEEDVAFLKTTAARGRELRLDAFLHLDQEVGIRNYVRIANEIAARVPRSRLLDWGCGFGQMTYLLRRRGFDVVAFDIGAPDAPLPDVPLCRDLRVVRSLHPTDLPFDTGAFDAVLSCGVLEHVDEFSAPGNEAKSLAEIRRVLRPDGHFVVYQLPQLYSWAEAVGRLRRRGYFHPRRFTEAEIRDVLSAAGYRIETLVRNNLLPKNLTGMPGWLRTAYSQLSSFWVAADGLLCRIPLLNRIAGVMELYARRTA